jgi:hypothetical protein
VTKVLGRLLYSFILLASPLTAWAQAESAANCPQKAGALYETLRTVSIDPQRVYHISGGAIDRPNLHLDFENGTIAFTRDICGRITGALFEGDGEILLRPPNRVERSSLALFTGTAILEEQFSFGFLRFNDDTAAVLGANLTAAENGADFVNRMADVSRALVDPDALRLLLDFSHFLPSTGTPEHLPDFPRFLHAHLSGRKLGGFEVYWDALASEQLSAGQALYKNNIPFFDTWTSFSPTPANEKRDQSVSDLTITNFHIRASVEPPTMLKANATLNVHVRKGGRRTLLFELSRYLKLDAVEEDGKSVEFIQNPAVEGTQLRRKGNDLVAVIFPAALADNGDLKLFFRYAGEVLSEANKGLLYVGERGSWYPSFGFSPSHFDLEFQYPAGWTLLATGKQVGAPAPDPDTNAPGADLQVSRWTSEQPIAVAGFNLGKYVSAESKSGNVVVEAYGTKGVEKSFPQAPAPDVVAPHPTFRRPIIGPIVMPPPKPSPARNVQVVADRAADAITSFTNWFGPYPYPGLALTQMPGDLSQGWPGLIFLSSYAFLSPQEQTDLHLDHLTALLSTQVLVHETAHQWWGDLVLWKSYRDQWIVEALANYASLLTVEQRNPVEFRQILELYRSDLLSKNKEGEPLSDAGPVTLGSRLISSHFPGGYEAISYERGTWLFHMLRCMLRDAESGSHSRNDQINPNEPFFRALRKVRDRYAGKPVSTQELIAVFAEELPRPLWYEKRRSLDWFLDGWINGTALPHLETHDVKFTPKENGVLVSGTIVQKDAPDDLVTAVPVYGAASGNSLKLLGVVLADGNESTFRVTAPAGTRRVVLDPEQTILTSPK